MKRLLSMSSALCLTWATTLDSIDEVGPKLSPFVSP
jgi:hypothetical protein